MAKQGAELAAHAPAPVGPQDHGLAQFFIPAAVSLSERRPRTLKHGNTFAVFDRNGDAIAGAGSPDGLYHNDTRYLSHFFLTIDGVRPILLSSTLRDDNATLTCDLANPDLFDGENRLEMEHDLIHIRRTCFLWDGGCYERLAMHNFDVREHEICLQIGFQADFADLFEVRGTVRNHHGSRLPTHISPDSIRMAYRGLDDIERRTSIRFDPVPNRIAFDAASYELILQPGKPEYIYVHVQCDRPTPEQQSRRTFLISLRSVRQFHRASARATSIATSNETFNECVRRSISDLYMLRTETDHGSYPYAGIPWFSTVFGRDALITALETLWIDPDMAKGVLRFLAAHQASQLNEEADAEPGKILHEMRNGEMAILGEVPFRHYYGSIDSTPLFVMLAGAYLEQTDDLNTISEIWPNIQAALNWIETYGDRDGDGFIEYGRCNKDGLINQGWKDSHDSIFHDDGSLAEGPIALAEVQAYVFGAYKAAVLIAKSLNFDALVRNFEDKAARLRDEFDSAFFDSELGTYVLALDGRKRPCRVRTSNAGHALFTGIAKNKRAPAVVTTLMSTASFSGWGIRTVANSEPRYNPMSYHNGSVWPHDNALIASGFVRYGFKSEASRVFEGMFAAAAYMDLRRLPELFCGFPRRRSHGPTFYPVACSPQAWSAATPISLLQSCLGIVFRPRDRQVELRQPQLPPFLSELILRRLKVGDALLDIEARRVRSETAVNVASRAGSASLLVIS